VSLRAVALVKMTTTSKVLHPTWRTIRAVTETTTRREGEIEEAHLEEEGINDQ